jgi:hypothetical protein
MRAISAVVLVVCFAPAALGANAVTGLVRNQSRDAPAVGDEVILLRLDRGMQDEARATTDAQGAFALNVQYPGRPYLVRVLHQGVNYDQQASGGDALSIQVFDAAAHVPGLTGTIEILRAGMNGNLLHVSDMYEIKNESSPHVTQAGQRTFEVYLPANAKIDSVLAAGPGKIGVMISAAPVPGEPGHYTLNFPLRPGATKFAFNYDLPYSGHAVFQTRHAYPLQELAVMTPPAMKFSSRSHAFEILRTGSSRYEVRAATQLKAGEGPEFEVSGTGAFPPLRDQAPSEAQSPHPLSSPTVSAASRTVGPPSPRAESPHGQIQSSSQVRILGVAIVVLLAACALVARRVHKGWRVASPGTFPRQASQAQRSITLRESLKEELFQLEADRIRGSISPEEYASARQALEETVKRTVARAS